MGKRFLVLIVVLMIALSGCNKGSSATDDKKDNDNNINSDESAFSLDKNFVDANNTFALDFFKEMVGMEPDINLFISPASISFLMAMVYNGASDKTKDEMASALKFEDMSLDKLNEQFRYLAASIDNVDPKIELDVANSGWVNDKTDEMINADFVEMNKKYYDAKFETLPFSDPKSLETINAWVEDETKGKIKNLLSELSDNSLLILINTLYFKATWKDLFDKEMTEQQSFHVTNDTKKSVPMMYQKNEYHHLKGDNFLAVKLPYTNDKLSMILILPNEGIMIDDFVKGITIDDWKKWMTSFTYGDVRLSFPRFTMDYKKKLKDVLEKMGVQLAFSDYATFPGICSKFPLMINDVIHQTYVDVNEEGTEAAAATAVDIVPVMAPSENDIFVFTADRPFIFVIQDERSNAILFMGKMMDPGVEK
ncbi:MAG: serpin family protein [Pseudomonadota bacterium]